MLILCTEIRIIFWFFNIFSTSCGEKWALFCKKIAICGLICRAKIFKRQYLRSYGLWDLILQFYCFCPNMTIAIFFSTWIQRKRKIFIFPIWHRMRYFDIFGKQSRLKFEEKILPWFGGGPPFIHWFFGKKSKVNFW